MNVDEPAVTVTALDRHRILVDHKAAIQQNTIKMMPRAAAELPTDFYDSTKHHQGLMTDWVQTQGLPSQTDERISGLGGAVEVLLSGKGMSHEIS